MANLRIKTLFLLQAIFVFLGSVEGGHELVRADAWCMPSATFGMVAIRDKERKVFGNIKNACECGNEARKLGAKLFMVCDNIHGFYCYVYTKTDGTCTLKHNEGKCNTYRVTKGNEACNQEEEEKKKKGASDCKSKDKKIADLQITLAEQTLLIAKLKRSCKRLIG